MIFKSDKTKTNTQKKLVVKYLRLKQPLMPTMVNWVFFPSFFNQEQLSWYIYVTTVKNWEVIWRNSTWIPHEFASSRLFFKSGFSTVQPNFKRFSTFCDWWIVTEIENCKTGLAIQRIGFLNQRNHLPIREYGLTIREIGLPVREYILTIRENGISARGQDYQFEVTDN